MCEKNTIAMRSRRLANEHHQPVGVDGECEGGREVMETRIAGFTSRCSICRGTIAVGEEICKWSGWAHTKCRTTQKKLAAIVNKAQDSHRESKGMDEMTYSVSYSRGNAMTYANEAGVITQDEYDAVWSDREYRILWNYVAD